MVLNYHLWSFLLGASILIAIIIFHSYYYRKLLSDGWENSTKLTDVFLVDCHTFLISLGYKSDKLKFSFIIRRIRYILQNSWKYNLAFRFIYHLVNALPFHSSLNFVFLLKYDFWNKFPIMVTVHEQLLSVDRKA